MNDYSSCTRRNNMLRRQLMQPRRVEYPYIPVKENTPNEEVDEGDLEKVSEIRD